MDTNMQGYADIQEFVEGLRFRKSLFGANTADVFAAMQDLDAMYRDAAIEESTAQQEIIDSLRQQADAQGSALELLREKLRLADEERERASNSLNSSSAEIEQLRQSARNNEEKTQQLLKAVNDVEKSRDAVQRQAVREGRQIIAEANKKADELWKERRAEVAAELRQSEELLAQQKQERKKLQQEMDMLYLDLVDLVEAVSNAKNKLSGNPAESAIGESSPFNPVLNETRQSGANIKQVYFEPNEA